jgi:hypothetical protein
VRSFKDYLREKGFFIADGSESRTLDSLVETASRLNYRTYYQGLDPTAYYEAIAHNRVFDEMKSLGYVTVVYDGMRAPLFYPAKTPIVADYQLEYAERARSARRVGLDAFGGMVLDLTVLRPFLNMEEVYGAQIARHAGEVLFGFERIADLGDLPSPRFVYAHMMVPHDPWVFDEEGRINRPECYYDWDCYLGSYLFTMKLLEGFVDEVLKDAGPAGLPVVILQSDHGARNQQYLYTGGVLPNYPEHYKYSILNAIYLPGHHQTMLPRDLDPLNVLPLILNSYFGYEIPLQ